MSTDLLAEIFTLSNELAAANARAEKAERELETLLVWAEYHAKAHAVTESPPYQFFAVGKHGRAHSQTIRGAIRKAAGLEES